MPKHLFKVPYLREGGSRRAKEVIVHRVRIVPLVVAVAFLTACGQTSTTTVPNVELATQAAAVQVIEQLTPSGSTNRECGIGQSFEVHISGAITQLDFRSIRSGSTKLVIGRFDDGTFVPLHEQVFAFDAVLDPIAIDPPLPVEPGTYAFLAETTVVTLDGFEYPIPDLVYGGQPSLPDPYIEGAMLRGFPKDGCLPIVEESRDAVFRVVIEPDTTPPALTVPADVAVEAGGDLTPNGTGFATATDDLDPNPRIDFVDATQFVPCTESVFGTLTRTWTAVDASGNAAAGDQIISVTDTTPPVITLPDDVTILEGENDEPSATGAASAVDLVNTAAFGYVDVRSDGATSRTWTAVDDCGNEASATQTITVLTWQAALADLVADVEAAGPPRGIENSLTRKLVNAIRNLDDGLNGEAREKIVSFIDQVDALSGKQLDATSAQAWIARAERILAVV